MNFYNLIGETFYFLLIIRSSTSNRNWWTDTQQLSFTLRLELFSFACGTHFLTAPANETDNCSVSDDERTVALTVVTMLQRLPIMAAVNQVVENVVSHLLPVAYKPPMRTFLRKLDGAFRKDDQLRDTFLHTKFALASVIDQLPRSDCIPYDRKSNVSLVLLRWSRDLKIRTFLVGNMLMNYHGLSNTEFNESALLIRILARLSRDSAGTDGAAVQRLYMEAVSLAAERSLKSVNVAYNDFQFSAYFLWYNEVANETLFRVLNEIRRDGNLVSKFYKIRNEFLGKQRRDPHHVLAGSSLQLRSLLETFLFCSSLFLVWSGGRYVYRKYRCESLPDWLNTDWDDSASLSELLVDENDPPYNAIYGPLVLRDHDGSDDNDNSVKTGKM